MQHGLRTIAFCKTRKMCELVTAYTRETLKDTAPHLANTISVYRAGYSPEVRACTSAALTPRSVVMTVTDDLLQDEEVTDTVCQAVYTAVPHSMALQLAGTKGQCRVWVRDTSGFRVEVIPLRYPHGNDVQERREIERALLEGDLWAVCATNALELGVDVGSLDVTLHLGFPGTVASLWQQVSRLTEALPVLAIDMMLLNPLI